MQLPSALFYSGSSFVCPSADCRYLPQGQKLRIGAVE